MRMMHSMGLQPEPFEKIKKGIKTIELRLFDEKRQKVSVGDMIEFTDIQDENRKINVTVTALYKTGDFSDLIDRFPIEKFGAENKEQVLQKLREFYSQTEEEKSGVLGIEVKLSNSL